MAADRERAAWTDCAILMAGMAAGVRHSAASRLYTRRYGLTLAHACRLGHFEAGSELCRIREHIDAMQPDRPTQAFCECWDSAELLVNGAWKAVVGLARRLERRGSITGGELQLWRVSNLSAVEYPRGPEFRTEAPWPKL